MKKTENKTIGIKLLTGIVLMLFVISQIYLSAVTASQLKVIPFMAVCSVIVAAGFIAAALWERSANKKRAYPIPGAAVRQLLEGLAVIAVIVVICCVIYVV